MFGCLTYTITSRLDENRMVANIKVPSRNRIHNFCIRLRTPGKKNMQSVFMNGQTYNVFNAATETIDLTGICGEVQIEVHYTDIGI